MAATTITRESMTDDVTVWNVTRIGSAIYDKIDAIIGANVTFGGLVHAEGFGSHLWSSGGTGANTLTLRNTTSGTGNYAGLLVGNNSTASLGAMFGFSSAYTSAGSYYASGVTVESTGAGGLNLNASNASGPFRLFTGNTQRLAIDSNGLLTPLNSLKIAAGFLAYNSADDASVANNTDIDFDTEVYDEGGNFSGDTFTAPVAGRYLLSAHVRLTNSTGGAIAMQPVFLVSNHSSGINLGYDSSVANGATVGFSGTVVVDMDASDTATVRYYGGGDCTVEGDASQRYTWFCGRLLL